jgi:methylmalonyl-CoA/ethylmalonyl-CoA epimerase
MSKDEFAFHHLGIAVKDLQSAIDSYKSLFAYDLVSGPFDDPIQKVSVCFLSRGDGDSALELVAPFGADSPVDRLLRKGGGLYHVCYEVPDIRHAIAHLVKLDSLLLSGPVPAVAFQMREIAWLMTDTNLLVELVQAP